MARILAISSQVVRGHVGLSAIVPALQRLGHEVLPIPTVLLSNHPGHVRAAGMRVEVNTLMSTLDVLEANGWLAALDAVMTGYLPTAAHVGFAAHAIGRVRSSSPGVQVIVDPVAGDDPRGLYIGDDAAAALRNVLVPLGDVMTPNRFELSWLSGIAVGTPTDAVRAAATLGRPTVLATSIPDGDTSLANVCAARDGAWLCRVARRTAVPQGTGDLLSGLFVGHRLNGCDRVTALSRAAAGVECAITASAGSSDLVLARRGAACDWSAAPGLPVVSLSV